MANEANAADVSQFERLVHELNHRIWEVRRDACDELGLLGDKRAIPALIRMLQDGIGGVRFAAAEALGRLGDRVVIPELLRLLDDALFGTHGPVMEALTSLKAKEAAPYFIRFLRDPDVHQRRVASNCLRELTGHFITYDPQGRPEARDAAARDWEAWWEQNKETFLAKP
jgi:HEAT repeat protein